MRELFYLATSPKFLRGFDAIHLASALSVKRAVGEDLTFAAADVHLLRAAESEGLTAINVENA